MTTATNIPVGGWLDPDQEAEISAYLEAQELAQDVSYLTHYGICSYVAYLQHCETEAAIYEKCLVAGFADDPITRSASFDGYEMAGMTHPIREKCAAQGCPLCQDKEV